MGKQTSKQTSTQKRLMKFVNEFKKRKVLVIGDVGIDRYVSGIVERISPEAPVPIVLVENETHKLGLAANVSDNIHALGGRSELIGVVGNDRSAEDLRRLLKKAKIGGLGLVVDRKRRTIVKERVVSDRQQLLRIDYETPLPLSEALGKTVVRRVKQFLSSSRGADVLIVQDYAKGMLSRNTVEEIVALARKWGKPVVMDPNAKSEVALYRGATFITPNTREAEKLSGVSIRDSKSLERAGSILLDQIGSPFVVITRGKEGMAVFTQGQTKPKLIPTYAREVYDVSGAGDTVISIMALAYASGASIEEAAILGNLGGGVVVGKRGTATVSPAELDQAMEQAVSTRLIR